MNDDQQPMSVTCTRFVSEGDPTSVFGKRFAGTTALRHWLPDFVRDDVLRMRVNREVWWYANGQRGWQGVCVDGKEHGEWTHWYSNGQKWWQGVCVDGKRHGEWTHWHENGQKSSQGAFVDGKRHGEWTNWHESGQKQWQGVFVDGKEHGEWIYFNENGDVFRREHWEHGRLLVTTTEG